jgi:hypothetical protein
VQVLDYPPSYACVSSGPSQPACVCACRRRRRRLSTPPPPLPTPHCHLRLCSIYGRDVRESYYRESMLGTDPAMAAAIKGATPCGGCTLQGLRLRLVPQGWQEVGRWAGERGLLSAAVPAVLGMLPSSGRPRRLSLSNQAISVRCRCCCPRPPSLPLSLTPRHPPPACCNLQPVCGVLDSLPWNLFILLLTLFSVFAPDIAIISSGGWPGGVGQSESAPRTACRAYMYCLQPGMSPALPCRPACPAHLPACLPTSTARRLLLQRQTL